VAGDSERGCPGRVGSGVAGADRASSAIGGAIRDTTTQVRRRCRRPELTRCTSPADHGCDVKKGTIFQQTDIGPIPSDWMLGMLRALVDPVRTIRYGIVQPGKYDPNGRYMIRGQDYSKGWVDPAEFFRVSPAVEEPFENARVRSGDVLITIVGASTGRIAIVPTWLDGANLTQTTARISVRADRIDNIYCALALGSPIGGRQVSNYLKGAAQPGLNCGDIEKFLIPLPPLQEQRAIAEALSDVDVLLGALDRLIAKKRDIKQAAMQQLLTGQTRLPGFNGEWEVKRLGTIVTAEKGQLITSATLEPGSVPVIAGGKEPAYFHNRANRTGTTITISASGASAGYVSIHKGPIFASDCSTISEKNHYDIHFVFYALRLKQDEIYRAQTGGAQPHIHPRDIHQIKAALPTSKDEQTAIATVLSDMDAELEAFEQRRAKTAVLKQGMMQELLTGRTRLV
jgi:type I restriction enzyme S subunit